jgi:chromosome segregation ATPase
MGDSSESLSKPEAEQLAELEAEFQSELERNAMAVRLLQQKAEEAKNAKLRVDQSQKRMETMQEKYTHMHKKVESTRQTLHEAEDRIVRQDKIRETCKDLQERARNYEEKMRQRQESNAMFTAEIGDFDFPIPLIDYDDDDEKIDGACAAAFASLPSANNAVANNSEEKVPKIDYAQTVLDLQEKLSRVSCANLATSSPSPSTTTEKSDTVSTDHVTTITANITTAQQQQQLQQPQQVEDQEVPNIDLNDSVQRLEAKCAGVREELGRMALSETYMRTKQAQLKAKKKEMLAQQAMIRAELKEKEAADMRQKVANMMKMLADRKMKLKVTENVIDKKDAVVDGVNKILERKERRAHYTQKQLQEQIAFGKKGAAKK